MAPDPKESQRVVEMMNEECWDAFRRNAVVAQMCYSTELDFSRCSTTGSAFGSYAAFYSHAVNVVNHSSDPS